jgi:hypothetical protein
MTESKVEAECPSAPTALPDNTAPRMKPATPQIGPVLSSLGIGTDTYLLGRGTSEMFLHAVELMATEVLRPPQEIGQEGTAAIIQICQPANASAAGISCPIIFADLS